MGSPTLPLGYLSELPEGASIATPFFFDTGKEIQSVNGTVVQKTHANLSSLTTSASEGMLSPHPGACRPSRDWAKSLSPHCKPTWCSIGATKLPPRGIGGVLALTPPLRWTRQRGIVQSPPTICSQPQRPKQPGGLYLLRQ